MEPAQFETTNYCHDPEILAYAAKRGLNNAELLNKILSQCEGPYVSVDLGIQLVDEYLKSRNKKKLVKSALSKRQKKAILEKHKEI